jgi:DNA-binding protein HU-beta
LALQGGQSIVARSAKTTKSPAAAKTSRPVTLKHLAAALAEEHQLTKRASEAVLGDLVGTITKHLKKGERIRIAGLGILQVRKRAARMGRNPATGGSNQDQGQQESRIQGGQGLKNGSLTAGLPMQSVLCPVNEIDGASLFDRAVPIWAFVRAHTP